MIKTVRVIYERPRTPRSQHVRATIRISSGGGNDDLRYGINYKAGNGFRQITIARPVHAPNTPRGSCYV